MSQAGTIKIRYVYPGQMVIADRPMALQAVVGPAVAVCLWDRDNSVAAMGHCLFPSPEEGERPTTRFLSVAIPMMLRRMEEKGAERSKIVAKVFGGAGKKKGLRLRSKTLGARNAREVVALLASIKIPIIAEDLGGAKGRRLVYLTKENRVRVMRTAQIREADWNLEQRKSR